MKYKIRRRNQRWLSKQCRNAMLADVPMSFFIRFPAQRAEMNNAERLIRRGKLLPDWDSAKFYHGKVSLPFISQRGKIYYYQTFFDKADVPEKYHSRWLEPDSHGD